MQDEKRPMILLTDTYPFGSGETFIENEVPYLAEAFDLTVVSSNTKDPQTRSVPEGVRVCRTTEKDGGHSPFRKLCVCLSFLFSPICRHEMKEILHGGKVVLNFRSSLYFYCMAKDVQKQIKAYGIEYTSPDTVIYSYWSNHKLLAFLDERKKIKGKIITRMHGYDLYNERYPGTHRQPFKHGMDKLIDRAVFVSQAGMDYYLGHFLVDRPEKAVLCRLGTKAPARLPTKEEDGVFTLCSCSNVIPLKRVGVIVQALKTVRDIPIRWVHFGDGSEFEAVKQAAKTLPPNVSASFFGRVSNDEVSTYYESHFVDCFITATETEGGCPVSIQEALSFGIPVIATDVGGIPEMLSGTSNILLNADPTPDDVAEAIRRVCRADEQRVGALRAQNIARWREDFDERTNNRKFVELLRSL